MNGKDKPCPPLVVDQGTINAIQGDIKEMRGTLRKLDNFLTHPDNGMGVRMKLTEEWVSIAREKRVLENADQVAALRKGGIWDAVNHFKQHAHRRLTIEKALYGSLAAALVSGAFWLVVNALKIGLATLANGGG